MGQKFSLAISLLKKFLKFEVILFRFWFMITHSDIIGENQVVHPGFLGPMERLKQHRPTAWMLDSCGATI